MNTVWPISCDGDVPPFEEWALEDPQERRHVPFCQDFGSEEEVMNTLREARNRRDEVAAAKKRSEGRCEGGLTPMRKLKLGRPSLPKLPNIRF